MDGKAREFIGVVSSLDTTTIYDGLGKPVMSVNPEITADITPSGILSGVALTDDLDEARTLVGRTVRVSVEVLDGIEEGL